jgi:Icc-related predicted phosphoesterase
MKIKLVSDLHLEFSDIIIENNGADVLVLAGDICVMNRLEGKDLYNLVPEAVFANLVVNFFERVSLAFKHVIYIAGNHEYYHGKLRKTQQIAKELTSMFANVYYLEKDSKVIDDVLFLGGTLWTNMSKANPIAMSYAHAGMNDFKLIRHDEKGYTHFRPAHSVYEHNATISAWEKMLSNSTHEKVVVVSHHAPSYQSIHEIYKGNPLNDCYASDLSDFILDHPKIKLWCHGHVHNPHDYMIGDTRVMCNPRGYESKTYSEDSGWDRELLITV